MSNETLKSDAYENWLKRTLDGAAVLGSLAMLKASSIPTEQAELIHAAVTEAFEAGYDAGSKQESPK